MRIRVLLLLLAATAIAGDSVVLADEHALRHAYSGQPDDPLTDDIICETAIGTMITTVPEFSRVREIEARAFLRAGTDVRLRVGEEEILLSFRQGAQTVEDFLDSLDVTLRLKTVQRNNEAFIGWANLGDGDIVMNVVVNRRRPSAF